VDTFPGHRVNMQQWRRRFLCRPCRGYITRASSAVVVVLGLPNYTASHHRLRRENYIGGERGNNVVVRDIFIGGDNLSGGAFEVPRLCSLVLLLEVNLKDHKSLGSEESKALG
jgi:hypothetical protein